MFHNYLGDKGNISRFKARLGKTSFFQNEDVENYETFSIVLTTELVLPLVGKFWLGELLITHVDISTAYLNEV